MSHYSFRKHNQGTTKDRQSGHKIKKTRVFCKKRNLSLVGVKEKPELDNS